MRERDEDSGMWRGEEGRRGGQRMKVLRGCGLRDTMWGGTYHFLNFESEAPPPQAHIKVLVPQLMISFFFEPSWKKYVTKAGTLKIIIWSLVPAAVCFLIQGHLNSFSHSHCCRRKCSTMTLIDRNSLKP